MREMKVGAFGGLSLRCCRNCKIHASFELGRRAAHAPRLNILGRSAVRKLKSFKEERRVSFVLTNMSFWIEESLNCKNI